MIKSAFLYRMPHGMPSAAHIEHALHSAAFTPCAPGQEKSTGWVPPREAHGPLIEMVAGQWILKLMTETKSVPSEAINVRVTEFAKTIEETAGRKPGKKETRELQADAKLELLPKAFPRKAATLIWIDPATQLLVVDASTQGKADAAITALVKSIDGFVVQLINTHTSPRAAMATWLSSKESPAGFGVDRECELKACDESKAVVRYGRHALDTDEVAAHIAMGKLPTRLALTWNSRVSFVLTEHLQLKKIEFLNAVFEETSSDNAADEFDANVSIMAGELRKLIAALLDALCGEVL